MGDEADADWQDGYKRQMEIYQWLLRKNGLDVSDTGYFVYCNGKTDKEAFDGKLEFDIEFINSNIKLSVSLFLFFILLITISVIPCFFISAQT